MKTSDTVIGLVVHSTCDYFAPLSFPKVVYAALRISKLGNSSVTYEIGIFDSDEQNNDKPAQKPAAVGKFVHVFVDNDSRKSVPIPDKIRSGLLKL
jgi:acyl-CoA thioester hydrolase